MSSKVQRKTCKVCSKTKLISAFPRFRRNPSPFCDDCRSGHAEKIKIARKARHRERYRGEMIAKTLWWDARARAKKNGVLFDISVEDVKVPSVCPVLGIPIACGCGKVSDGSPSIDRVDPAKGYVRGNVEVISFKANTIKSNATPAELMRVAMYYRFSLAQ